MNKVFYKFFNFSWSLDCVNYSFIGLYKKYCFKVVEGYFVFDI